MVLLIPGLVAYANKAPMDLPVEISGGPIAEDVFNSKPSASSAVDAFYMQLLHAPDDDQTRGLFDFKNLRLIGNACSTITSFMDYSIPEGEFVLSDDLFSLTLAEPGKLVGYCHFAIPFKMNKKERLEVASIEVLVFNQLAPRGRSRHRMLLNRGTQILAEKTVYFKGDNGEYEYFALQNKSAGYPVFQSECGEEGVLTGSIRAELFSRGHHPVKTQNAFIKLKGIKARPCL